VEIVNEIDAEYAFCQQQESNAHCVVQVLPRQFLSLREQLEWCFVRGVDGDLPARSCSYRGQTGLHYISASVGHETNRTLLIVVNHAGKLFFRRIYPIT
jgi:hypothetical protein